MHRVELKGGRAPSIESAKAVPNAPCGVESFLVRFLWTRFQPVPNAPCGVESPLNRLKDKDFVLFLMHRVELKDKQKLLNHQV